MDLESVTLSEISQRQTNIVWIHLYVESIKYSKLMNITEKKDSQVQRTEEWLPVGRQKGK